MTWLRRQLIAAVICVAVISVSAVASTATEVTYAVAGVETGVTNTTSSFMGFSTSNDGDQAFWQTVIERTAFDENRNAVITGGWFRLDGRIRTLEGEIVGGSILNRTSRCRKETFIVAGDIAVATGGFGRFEVLLKHYRTRVFGQCVTYSATVEGTVTFTLP